jgi:hypothetical protein
MAALETTQEAIAARRNELLEHRRYAASTEGVVAQAADAQKTLIKTILNETLAEAKTKERWTQRRSSCVAFADNVSRVIQPLFGTEAMMREVVAKNRRDAKLATSSVARIAIDRSLPLSAGERHLQTAFNSSSRSGILVHKQISLEFSMRPYTLLLERSNDCPHKC